MRQGSSSPSTIPGSPASCWPKAITKAAGRRHSWPGAEVEALVRRRLGQTEFRAGLLDYWRGSCAVTGIAQPELLRASHIKPWAHCGNDAERLDVYNGFLLTADWDAAFDAGLVSFDTDGVAVFSPALSQAAHTRLGAGRLHADRPLTDKHRQYLAWHATRVFVGRPISSR